MNLRQITRGINRIQTATKVLAFAGALLLAPAAFATINACPGASTALSSLITDGGCFTTDVTYSNFTVTNNSVAVINGVTLNPGGIYGVNTVLASQIFARVSSTDPGMLLLNSPGPAASDPFCASNSGSGGWCVNAPTLRAVIQTTSYTMTFNSSVSTLGVSIRAVSHSSGQTDGASVAFREFCIGVATFTCASGDANYRVIQAGVLTGQNLDQIFSGAVNFAPNTLFAVRDTVYVHNSGANGSYGTILNYDSTDAPEPATFGLIGSALAGLLFLRRRRK